MPALPEGHYWGEYIRDDDPQWTGIRNSLIGFFAIGPKPTPDFLGTGFIIAGSTDGFVLALTAKHVIVDAAIEVQMPNPRRLGSSSIFFEPPQPSIEPTRLRAIWMGAETTDVLLVRHVTYPHNLDFALCVLEHQSEYINRNETSKTVVALDARLPDVGEWIHVAALTDFVFEGTQARYADASIWKVGTRPVLRVGKVLSHEDGALGHRGPCFRTTVPVRRGMSGGFAYVPRDGHAIAACGIVSSAAHEDHAQTSFLICGNSTFAGVIDAFGLQLPAEICGGVPLTLLDLLRADQITEVSGAAWETEIADVGQDGSYRIVRRSSRSGG